MTPPTPLSTIPLRFAVPAASIQTGRLLRFPLRLADRPLVVPGQRVESGQPIIEHFREQEAVEIPTTAAIVGLRPGDFLDDVPVPQSSRLGRKSPQATYRTRVCEHGRDGLTRLAAGSGETIIHAPASGVVETVLPGRIDIRADGLAVDAQVGLGPPRRRTHRHRRGRPRRRAARLAHRRERSGRHPGGWRTPGCRGHVPCSRHRRGGRHHRRRGQPPPAAAGIVRGAPAGCPARRSSLRAAGPGWLRPTAHPVPPLGPARGRSRPAGGHPPGIAHAHHRRRSPAPPGGGVATGRHGARAQRRGP